MTYSKRGRSLSSARAARSASRGPSPMAVDVSCPPGKISKGGAHLLHAASTVANNQAPVLPETRSSRSRQRGSIPCRPLAVVDRWSKAGRQLSSAGYHPVFAQTGPSEYDHSFLGYQGPDDPDFKRPRFLPGTRGVAPIPEKFAKLPKIVRRCPQTGVPVETTVTLTSQCASVVSPLSPLASSINTPLCSTDPCLISPGTHPGPVPSPTVLRLWEQVHESCGFSCPYLVAVRVASGQHAADAAAVLVSLGGEPELLRSFDLSPRTFTAVTGASESQAPLPRVSTQLQGKCSVYGHHPHQASCRPLTEPSARAIDGGSVDHRERMSAVVRATGCEEAAGRDFIRGMLENGYGFNESAMYIRSPADVSYRDLLYPALHEAIYWSIHEIYGSDVVSSLLGHPYWSDADGFVVRPRDVSPYFLMPSDAHVPDGGLIGRPGIPVSMRKPYHALPVAPPVVARAPSPMEDPFAYPRLTGEETQAALDECAAQEAIEFQGVVPETPLSQLLNELPSPSLSELQSMGLYPATPSSE